MTSVAHLAECGRRSAETRSRKRQARLALRGLPPQQLIPAVINASEDLAAYRLKTLFAAREAGAKGLIPGFSHMRLERALAELRRKGNEWAKPEIRLRQLTILQRRRLMRAILKHAPTSWVRPPEFSVVREAA